MFSLISIIYFSLCLVIAMVLALAISHFYNEMIFSSENMGITNNSTLKQIKLKYETLFKLQHTFGDSKVYVTRCLNKIYYARLSLCAWERLFINLSFTFSFIAALIWYLYYCGITSVFNVNLSLLSIQNLLLSLTMLLLHFYLALSAKNKLLSTNIEDYIVNYLLPRLQLQSAKEATYETTEDLFDNQKASENFSCDNSFHKNCVKDNKSTGQAVGNVSVGSSDNIKVHKKRNRRNTDSTTSDNETLQDNAGIQRRSADFDEAMLEELLADLI